MNQRIDDVFYPVTLTFLRWLGELLRLLTGVRRPLLFWRQRLTARVSRFVFRRGPRWFLRFIPRGNRRAVNDCLKVDVVRRFNLDVQRLSLYESADITHNVLGSGYESSAPAFFAA